MNSIEINEKIPIIDHYDVIVAGGGVAGVAAAISAKRLGKKVLLIEKSMQLGGLATLGLINLFVPMCNGRGTQIIFGMAEELLQLSIKYGYDTIPKEWQNGEPDKPTNTRYLTKFSAGIFALTLTELLVNEGVSILFDSVVSKPVMKGRTCEGLVVENKSGRQYYTANMIVDATGDADILFRAGVPTIQGKNFFTYAGFQVNLEDCKKAVENGKIHYALSYVKGGTANLYGGNHPDDMPYFTGTSSDDINRYLINNQLLMLENIKKDDRWSRDIVTLPGMAQYRTTRCIDGEYVLQEEDVFKHFDDSIGAICDFERRDYLFEIPFRTMIKRGFDNLITAGRSVAGDKYAWDVVRVIPPAIISGQAAGAAASLAIDTNEPIYNIDIKKLQNMQADANVMIHFDDSLIPDDFDGSTDNIREDIEEL